MASNCFYLFLYSLLKRSGILVFLLLKIGFPRCRLGKLVPVNFKIVVSKWYFTGINTIKFTKIPEKVVFLQEWVADFQKCEIITCYD